MPIPPSNPIDSSAADGEGVSNESQSPITSSSADLRQAFEDAAKAIVGGSSPCAGDSASIRGEIGNLESWARDKALIISEQLFENLNLVSNSTSEHEVFFREVDSRAVKRTLAGFFGQVPFPENGKLGRRNATPSEYLQRMALQLAVFGGDIRLEGVYSCDKPSLIVCKRGEKPSPLGEDFQYACGTWPTGNHPIVYTI